MKINLEDIPEEGTLNVDFLENEANLNKLFQEDFCFNSPAKGSFRISKRGKTVFVSLHIEGCAETRCSKCLSDFKQLIEIDNNVSLFPEDEEEGPREIDLTSEDAEKNFYTGNSIDLEKLLCEEIALYLPFNPRCSDNCKGLCPSCGKNLNEGKCGCGGIKKENPFAQLKDIKF